MEPRRPRNCTACGCRAVVFQNIRVTPLPSLFDSYGKNNNCGEEQIETLREGEWVCEECGVSSPSRPIYNEEHRDLRPFYKTGQ